MERASITLNKTRIKKLHFKICHSKIFKSFGRGGLRTELTDRQPSHLNLPISVGTYWTMNPAAALPVALATTCLPLGPKIAKCTKMNYLNFLTICKLTFIF